MPPSLFVDRQRNFSKNPCTLLNSNANVYKCEDIVLIIQDLIQYAKYHFRTGKDYMIQSQVD
jgi:hemerythrin